MKNVFAAHDLYCLDKPKIYVNWVMFDLDSIVVLQKKIEDLTFQEIELEKDISVVEEPFADLQEGVRLKQLRFVECRELKTLNDVNVVCTDDTYLSVIADDSSFKTVPYDLLVSYTFAGVQIPLGEKQEN